MRKNLNVKSSNKESRLSKKNEYRIKFLTINNNKKVAVFLGSWITGMVVIRLFLGFGGMNKYNYLNNVLGEFGGCAVVVFGGLLIAVIIAILSIWF